MKIQRYIDFAIILFSRPLILSCYFLLITILASPFVYIYGVSILFDFGLYSLILVPISILANASIYDIFNNIVVRSKFQNIEFWIFINSANLISSFIFSFIIVLTLTFRLIISGFYIDTPVTIKYFFSILLFFFLENLLFYCFCEILHSRIKALFLSFLPIIYEYLSSSNLSGYRFIFIYNSINSILYHSKFLFALILFILFQIILLLKTKYINKEFR